MKYINIFTVDIERLTVSRGTFDNYIQNSLEETSTEFTFDIDVTGYDGQASSVVIYKAEHQYVTEEEVGEIPLYTNNLAIMKKLRLNATDIKTNKMIYTTLVPWPPQAPVAHFSLSEEAQRNWIGLMIASPYLTYPYNVSCDEGSYGFSDDTEYGQFYFYGLGLVADIIGAGRAIKAQINACTTTTELEAIVDNR